MTLSTRSAQRSRQSGAVMLVSLILLVVLTLFVLAAMNFTNVQTRIAGNMQVRNELKSVAQQAIEQVISANFSTNPAPNDVSFDVNGDGTNDYAVHVTHTCVSSLTIKVDDLNITNPSDLACTLSASEENAGRGIATPSNASLCADSLWDVAATATDASTATFKTGGSVTVHQGIAIRVSVGSGC